MAESLEWPAFGAEHQVLKWITYNFKGEKRLESPKFSIGSESDGYVCSLYLIQTLEDGEEWYRCCICVHRVPTNPPRGIPQHRLAVFVKEVEVYSLIQKLPKELSVDDFIGVKLIKKKELRDYDPWVAGMGLGITYHIRFLEYKNTLVMDLENLFDTQRNSDIKLIVGNREIMAHKAIISARSAVFAAMFETEMKESIENQVIIEDIDPDIFQQLLCFMYTDKVKKLDVHSLELLKAADRYQVEGLKVLYEHEFSKSVNTENFLALLATADVYNCDSLKRYISSFISHNAEKIMFTEEYKIIAEKNPHLTRKAFKPLAVYLEWITDKYRALSNVAYGDELGQLGTFLKDELLKNENVENCAAYLVTTDLYNYHVLNETDQHFTDRNMKKTLLTEKYETVMREHPTLAVQAFASLASRSRLFASSNLIGKNRTRCSDLPTTLHFFFFCFMVVCYVNIFMWFLDYESYSLPYFIVNFGLIMLLRKVYFNPHWLIFGLE